jgi:hypothetical protein
MADEAEIGPPIDDAAVGRREIGLFENRAHVARVLRRFADDLVTGRYVAGERERRNEDRECRERAPHARVPALRPQPEMNTDRGVHPNGQQRGGLDQHVFRQDHPLQHQDLDVVAVHAQQFAGNARGQHVHHQQRRDAQAKPELPPFPSGQPQITPLVDRPQRVDVMHERRREQDRAADRGVPRRHEERERAVGHRERDEQRYVADEMADHEREHNQRADEPQPAAHRPHVPARSARRRVFEQVDRRSPAHNRAVMSGPRHHLIDVVLRRGRPYGAPSCGGDRSKLASIPRSICGKSLCSIRSQFASTVVRPRADRRPVAASRSSAVA